MYTGAGSVQGITNVGATSVASAAPASTGKGYYYDLLIAAYSGTLNSTDLGNAAVRALWTDTGLLATNYIIAGSLAGPGGNSGTTVAGWASAPSSGSAYTDGTEMQFMIVGWSANLGSSWGSVASQLATKSWTGYRLLRYFSRRLWLFRWWRNAAAWGKLAVCCYIGYAGRIGRWLPIGSSAVSS